MKIRIEIEDKGLKSIHEFESQAMDGEILRERIMSFLNASMVFSDKGTSPAAAAEIEAGGTLMDRLERFIRFEFPDNWFTTQELRDRYETVSDDIKLSTVSTYLSRMNRDGLLERRGNRNNRQYRLLREAEAEGIAQNNYSRRRIESKG